MRRPGSYCMHLSNKSMPASPMVLRKSAQPCRVQVGNRILNEGMPANPGHSSKVGVPNFLKISNMVLISEVQPPNTGLHPGVAISAMTQPTLQMSAGTLYNVLPSKSSGGLYHNVITSVVYDGTGTLNILARPKSAILSCNL